MPTTTLDFSAQIGGRDAAKALLPHFRALKSAAKGRTLAGFPFRELAFILRVDGEVAAYGQSGPGNIRVARKGGYVSVDIGITRDDQAGLGSEDIADFVAGAIVSSVNLLRNLGDARLGTVDWEALTGCLQDFAHAYRAEVVGARRDQAGRPDDEPT